MPHDKNGKLLQIGDEVTVRAKVTSVNAGAEYCNVGLETVEPMHPTANTTALSLNAAQVEKLDAAASDQADGGGNAEESKAAEKTEEAPV